MEIIGRNGRTSLDLNGANAAACLIKEIAFQTPCIAEEGQVGWLAPIETVFERLRHDRILKKCSTQRMGCNLRRMFDTDEIAGQPNVVEVELGRLDQTLSEVGVKWLELENDVARFQHRELLSRCRVGDAGVRTQRGKIDQLADSSGAQARETSEIGKVADRSQPADITLDVGL